MSEPDFTNEFYYWYVNKQLTDKLSAVGRVYDLKPNLADTYKHAIVFKSGKGGYAKYFKTLDELKKELAS